MWMGPPMLTGHPMGMGHRWGWGTNGGGTPMGMDDTIWMRQPMGMGHPMGHIMGMGHQWGWDTNGGGSPNVDGTPNGDGTPNAPLCPPPAPPAPLSLELRTLSMNWRRLMRPSWWRSMLRKTSSARDFICAIHCRKRCLHSPNSKWENSSNCGAWRGGGHGGVGGGRVRRRNVGH